MSGIQAESLTKSYVVEGVTTEVLKGIDLHINEGESLCLYGPSGAGKSTLLYLLGGLEKPTTGRVKVLGCDLQQMGDDELSLFRNKKMGFIFQFHHLLPDFSALENVMMPLLIGGMSTQQARKASQDMLSVVGLLERQQHRPSQLSGGEQQRVAIARALVHKPKFIFADEPTGNLDHINGGKVFDLLLSLNRELRATLVVVTHNESMTGLFNKKIKILDGRIDH